MPNEQMDLMNTGPDNSSEIAECAREYIRIDHIRESAAEAAKGQLQQLAVLIKDSGLTPIDDDKIVFTIDGITISVTPRDDSIKVKNEGNDGD